MSSSIRIGTTVITLACCLAFGMVITHEAAPARAQCTGLPPIDGRNIPNDFPIATSVAQDNPTGFGDVIPPTPQDSEGNELDQMFLTNDDTTLYIGITGNTERLDNLQNTVLVFIDTPAIDGTAVLSTFSTSTCCVTGMPGGCDTPLCETCVCTINVDCCGVPPDEWSQACLDLAFADCLDECPCGEVNTSSAVRGIDGVTLDFAPEYVLAVWNDNGVQTGLLIDLRLPPDTSGILLVEGTEFAVDNQNLVGVNDEAAFDPTQQSVNAATAEFGFEFAIPLGFLNITNTDAIKLQALIVSGSGNMSNQSLPPLNETVVNVGGGVNCVGSHDPAAVPPNIVDFSDNVKFPGSQNQPFTLTSGNTPLITLDGDIKGPANTDDWGTAAITQNNFTCFGDARPFAPGVSGGSELDRIFITNDDAKLYIGVTGNIPTDGGNNDTILVFIETGDGFGVNTLATASHNLGSPALTLMDGVTFDLDFEPSWVLEYWRGGNQHNAVLQHTDFSASIFDDLKFSLDTADHIAAGIDTFSADLSNLLGVNNIPGDDPIRQEALAPSAVAGVQFSVRLSDMGLSAFQTIEVMACIASGTGFISNQFLPPLNPTLPPPVCSTDTFNPGAAIADAGTTSNTQTLAGAGAIVRVTGLQVAVNITHLAVEELIIDLVHDTSGRTVRLWDDTSGSGVDLNVNFAEDGIPLPDCPAPGPATVAPLESLLTFNDVDPNDGTWSLFIQDTATGNTGTLNSWTLDLQFDVGGAVGCLGTFDGATNPINLGTDPRTPGDQFTPFTLLAPPGTAPTDFSSQNVPAAFPAAELSVQNNYTCFLDAIEAAPSNPPGSEMDRMFVTNTNDVLKVGITGNLENNENAYILLLDTDPTPGVGENPIGGVTPITPPPSPLGGGFGEPGLNGLMLDTTFEPEWGLVVHRQDSSAPANDYSVFLTDLRTNFTRAIGRLVRNSGSGFLLNALPIGNSSELDELYVQNDLDNLYIGITGNLENNGNTYLIFLDTEASVTTNTLSTDFDGYSNQVRAVHGDILDLGITPDHIIMINRDGGNYFAQLENITNTASPIITPLTFDLVLGTNTFVGSNTNGQGVNGEAADDALDVIPPGGNGVFDQIDNAMTANDGVQFCIERSLLGSPVDLTDIRITVALVNGGGFWSNQLLPGLGGGAAQLGDPNPLDLTLDGIDEFATFNLADAGGHAAPSSFTGALIPAAMGGVGTALETQDNHTAWGDQTLPPNEGNPNCMQVAFDDSNLIGVTVDTAAEGSGMLGDPLQPETGMEFDIPFADIGLTAIDLGGDGVNIKVLAILTGRRGFLSNQFLPPLGTGDKPNLGNAGLIDLSDSLTFPGDQFLAYTTIVPCGLLDPADINGDGTFDPVVDTDTLVNVLMGTDTDPCHVLKANVDGLGNIDGLDIQAYVNAALP